MRRRTFLTSTAAGVPVLTAGCLINDEGNGGGGGDGGAGDSDVTVGIVYSTGGLGDESFNDMANQGIERAQEELGIEYQSAEPGSPADMNDMQRQFAGNDAIDVVVCIGFDHEADLQNNATEFSDTQFVLVDAVVEAENVASYVFREQEGSFQVGHLAGLLTGTEYAHGGGETNPTESIVGFVGGEETSLIERFEAGYVAGAQYADEAIQTPSAYAGSWTDPTTGQEIASGMYNDGADIVYHAAGGTGGGVFEAAQSSGRFAIGVDDDQSVSAEAFSDVIVASMIKRVDTAVFESIQSIVEDSFEGGQVNDLGLEEEGVGAVIGQDFEGELPTEITDALAESRQAIIDGEIDVPTTRDGL
ncbi:BMP family lipoprotein [Halalkalicoccus jeotgali]|uniref:ABC transporter periplasmic substrate-binding protein n=1 Tax=Halalkalicoccus jeotgali (strain DSM 18796 / CECT 7217 / JCM 14584 / KCTC 4019 / B3) TaxID=795797 RepID=D8J7L2_HALJB|nr:BMP family ABC transporter substrate-binding protein [Halalkalicoccus jeotgali]ADJ16032.1 ABC-type transport system periplasmic substrate-binding protein (probable substrate sugar) [Halalkalicoccus jeotgali B3]ELY38128.1 ABC transporter periplasmic substrate-binding protein [Halalkalicoccus jeotgali B3]